MAWTRRLAPVVWLLAAACQDGGGPAPVPDPMEDPPAPVCTPLLARTAAARLTHRQWARTVEDLLGLRRGDGDALVGGFIPDPRSAGFDNGASQLQVTGGLGRAYQTATAALADRVADDPALLARWLPCGDASIATVDGPCATTFLEAFLSAAFRRPATDDEISRYLAVYDDGARLRDTRTANAAGAHLVIQAALQSPKFLYRLERDAAPTEDAPDATALDGFEVASRLSYFLWNSMPDDALFAAAAAGDLATPEGVRTEAERMVADPRARDAVEDFHAQWLRTRDWTELIQDPAEFPAVDPSLPASMREEQRRFVEHVVFEERAGLAELLTSPVTFVDARLAAVYGIEAPSMVPGFRQVTLDPAERAGLLTQSGFLAFHADTLDPSPIRRGVFVQREVLCTTIPDPPGDADLDLPPRGGVIYTNRQRVESHTDSDGCQVCHRLINQTGFAFEHYDALGGWREEDNRVPIDASASIPMGPGDVIDVDGAVALLDAVVTRPATHRCYATRLTRYALGRQETREDACLVDLMTERGLEGASTLDLLLELATSEAMRFRAPLGPLATADDEEGS